MCIHPKVVKPESVIENNKIDKDYDVNLIPP